MKGDGVSGNGGAESQRVNVKQACTVLYKQLPPLRSALLQAALQPTVGPCVVEWAEANSSGVPLVGGIAQFGPHKIVMVALEAPVRREILDRTVAVSPMPEELRQEMLDHRASIRLLYTGDAADAVEQLTALYRVAGALLAQGGLGLVNERAALALPAERAVQHLAELGSGIAPMPLWVGTVTFSVDDVAAPQPYLMRTYGMEQFGLPDLGIYISRELADDAYHLLLNVCLYAAEGGGSWARPNSGSQLSFGQRVDFGGLTYLLVEPDAGSAEFAGPGGLLLLMAV